MTCIDLTLSMWNLNSNQQKTGKIHIKRCLLAIRGKSHGEL